MKLNLFATLALFISLSASAKTFSNSYISFDLPDDWNCAQEGPSWVCSPKIAKDAREAIIVINAKVAGPEDNLANYKNYLSKPRTITLTGTPVTSKVMQVEELPLGAQSWVRAQHLSSEVPGFYTLYLVTTKSQLAILVSFSVEKSKALDYNKIFDKAVRTLKIVATKELLIPSLPSGRTGETIGIQIDSSPVEEISLPPPKKKSRNPLVWIVGLLVIAGLTFYIWKNRK